MSGIPSSGDTGANRVFYPLSVSENVDGISEIVIYFHGLVRDERYPEDSNSFSTELFKTGAFQWLNFLDRESRMKVYISSYKKYGDVCERGQVNLYALGNILFKGVVEVLHQHGNGWNNSHVILIGHSVGGLAIKQLILQAEGSREYINKDSEEDPSLMFLNRLAGIFYFSTPHSNVADLTRLIARGGSQMGATLAALGRVTQRLNHQFLDRRIVLGIPSAAVSEHCRTTILSNRFNEIVVTEASARMDVDVFMTADDADHFSVCEIENNQDPRFKFLLQQISYWVQSAERKAATRRRAAVTVT